LILKKMGSTHKLQVARWTRHLEPQRYSTPGMMLRIPILISGLNTTRGIWVMLRQLLRPHRGDCYSLQIFKNNFYGKERRIGMVSTLYISHKAAHWLALHRDASLKGVVQISTFYSDYNEYTPVSFQDMWKLIDFKVVLTFCSDCRRCWAFTFRCDLSFTQP
jgi:hypothetical protein